MARRVRGFGYDYPDVGGGGDLGYTRYEARAPEPERDSFSGFTELAKALGKRRIEQDKDREQAQNYARQNLKHIPESELSKYKIDWRGQGGGRGDADDIYGEADYAVKQWDLKRAEEKKAADAAEAAAKSLKGIESEEAAREKLRVKQQADARTDAVGEARRLQVEGSRYEQKRTAAERAFARERMSAAASGRDPRSVTAPDVAEPEPGKVKRVPVYAVEDEYDPLDPTGAKRYIDIPVTDERTFLTDIEAQNYERQGVGEEAPPPPPPDPNRVARRVTPETRGAIRQVEREIKPAIAEAARPRRPEAAPYASPRTPEQVYENKVWGESVKKSKAAVAEAEKSWGRDAVGLHAEDVTTEYEDWREQQGLPPLDEAQRKTVLGRAKLQASRYLAGPARGQPQPTTIALPGEPTFKSERVFGLPVEERNRIGEEAWEHPSRPYPGLYAEGRKPPAATPAAPAAPAAKAGGIQQMLLGLTEPAPVGELAARSVLPPEGAAPAAREPGRTSLFRGPGEALPQGEEAYEATPEQRAENQIRRGLSEIQRTVPQERRAASTEALLYGTHQKEYGPDAAGIMREGRRLAQRQIQGGATPEEATAAATDYMAKMFRSRQQAARGQNLADEADLYGGLAEQFTDPRSIAKMAAITIGTMALAPVIAGGLAAAGAGATLAGVGGLTAAGGLASLGTQAGDILTGGKQPFDLREAGLTAVTSPIIGLAPGARLLEQAAARVANPAMRTALRFVATGYPEASQEWAQAVAEGILNGQLPTGQEQLASALAGFTIGGGVGGLGVGRGKGREGAARRGGGEAEAYAPTAARSAEDLRAMLDQYEAEREAAAATGAPPPEITPELAAAVEEEGLPPLEEPGAPALGEPGEPALQEPGLLPAEPELPPALEEEGELPQLGEPGTPDEGDVLARLQAQVNEYLAAREAGRAARTVRGRQGAGLETVGEEALVTPGIPERQAGGMPISPGGIIQAAERAPRSRTSLEPPGPPAPTTGELQGPLAEMTPDQLAALQAGPPGEPIEGAPPLPPGAPRPEVETIGFPEGALQPTNASFAAWVDIQFGPGTYDQLQADWKRGDRSVLDQMRRAYAIARQGSNIPATRGALSQAEAEVQDLKAQADVARTPMDRNRLREEARAAERRVEAGRAMRGPEAVQPGAGNYGVMLGPDDQYYVTTVAEPRMREGEPVGPGGRRGLLGPFGDSETAARAAAQMDARFRAEGGAELEPGKLQTAEKKWAGEIWKQGGRRAGERLGAGAPSPAELAPGVEPRPPAAKPKPKAKRAAKAAPKKRTVADIKAAAERYQAERGARKKIKPKPEPEPELAADEDEPSEEELDMLRQLVDTSGSPSDLADMLGITSQEAGALIAAGRARRGEGGATAMADPLGVGTIMQLFEQRRAKAAGAAVERRAAVKLKQQRIAAGETQEAGTLKGEGEKEDFGRTAFKGMKAAAAGARAIGAKTETRGKTTVTWVPKVTFAGRARTLAEVDPAQLQAVSGIETPEQFMENEPAVRRMQPDDQLSVYKQYLENEFYARGLPPPQLVKRGGGGEGPPTKIIVENEGAALSIDTRDGRVRELARNRDFKGVRGQIDVIRAFAEAGRLGGRFEVEESISPDTAELYDTIASRAGLKPEELQGRLISEVIDEAPALKAFVERFEARGKSPTTANFLGLQTAYEAAKNLTTGKLGQAAWMGPRPVLEHLSQLSPTGKSIAQHFELYRDTFNTTRGQWFSEMQKALAGVETPQQRAHFVDALEGKAPHTAGTKRARVVLDEVARLAQSNERFSQYLADYFPRILMSQPDFAAKATSGAREFWKEPTHKANMQALGATNWTDPQAAQYAAGILMFPGGRLYGGSNPNLEKIRTGMQIDYRRDPEVLYQYLNSAARAITQAQIFDAPRLTGPSATTGKTQERFGDWKRAWGRLALEGKADEGTITGLREALERELGIDQGKRGQYDDHLSAARDIIASTSLFLSPLTQFGSLGDTAATLGAATGGKGLKTAIQGVGRRTSAAAEDAAIRAGSVTPSGIDEARAFQEESRIQSQTGGAKGLQSLAKAYRNAPWMKLMQGIDRAMRISADSSARLALPDVIRRGKAGDKGTLKILRHAGVDQRILNLSDTDAQAAAQYGQLSPDTQRIVDNYARRITEFTQQRSRPGDLPKGWSTPTGQWLSMFMPFGYRQTRNMFRAIASNPAGFAAAGLPAYLVLGAATGAARAVLTGYGMGGEKDDDLAVGERVMAIFGNRPIRPDSPEDFALRAAQILVRVAPKPAIATLATRFERAEDAGGAALSLLGPGARAFEAAESVSRGLRGRDLPATMSRGEYAARGLTTGLAQLLGPSAYSYQLQRELMGEKSQFPRKDVPVAPRPGLVGRSLDVARGEISPEQFTRGIFFGGEETLSKKRKKRAADIAQSRKRTSLRDRAQQYESTRGIRVGG